MQRADVILWLGDPEEAPAHDRLIRVHAQADRAERRDVPAGSVAVSVASGAGLGGLARQIAEEARRVLPVDGELALNRRQAHELEQAHSALGEGAGTDLVRFAQIGDDRADTR